jgi:branched-chain amino acid transport system substrate-binding protein
LEFEGKPAGFLTQILRPYSPIIFNQNSGETTFMVRKLTVLLLVIALLPACAMPPAYPPGAPASRVRNRAAALFQKAEDSYSHQAYRQAFQDYNDYVARYPQGPRVMEARLRAADILGILGNWRGALARYQRISTLQPQPEISQQARYGIGRSYFKLGQYQQASQVLNNLTAENLSRSLWFSTQALLAEIALKQDRVPQAFNRLRLAAQDLSSGDPEWFRYLKSRLLEQATNQELVQLANLYRENSLSAALLLRLVRRAQDSKKTEEAYKWVSVLKERFPNSPETAKAEQLLAGGKVLMGCLLPLSGKLSAIGFRVRQGMELAAKGTPVALVFRDTGGDAATASAVTRNLAQDKNVLAILGPLASSTAQSAADEAQTASTPLIALSQKNGLTRTGPWIFQAFMTPRQQVRALVSQALKMGIRRFAILYPDSPYGRTFFQDYQEEVAAQGGELAAQTYYNAGTQEFGPTLSALAASLETPPGQEPTTTALFIPDDADTVAAIAKGLANTSLKGIQLLGTNLLHNGNLSPDQLQALQGTIFPDAFFPRDPNPEVQKFIAAYRQKYKQDPDYMAAQGYLVVRVMAQIVETHQNLSRMALPQQLLTLKSVPGLPWFQGFNAQRQEVAALYILTITNQGIQMVPPASGSEPPQ